jgi:hypothetical protein
MSSFSKGLNFNTNGIQIGGYGGNVDLTCSNEGGKILVNGVEPTGGSGGQLPLTGTGDISITGNITASGDGVSSGKIEGESMKSKGVLVVDGKLSVPTSDLEVTNGKIIVGAGNIEQGSAGKIVSGTGGLESHGDIITIGAKDLIMGNNIYFEGTDIYKRENNPPQDTSYKVFKGLVARNDSTIWTGTNDFANTVRLGTESNSVFTPSGLTLNTNGTLQSVNINNTTLLQCGNINCGNGGTNEIRCKTIITRTNEDDVSNPDGWKISQEKPSNPAQQIDRILDFQAQEANAYISIRSSEPSQIVPNIVLNPRTSALGGEIISNLFRVGDGALTDWNIENPKTGTDTNNLVITAGGGANAEIRFKNNSGADIINIRETALLIANPLPLQFGAYSFKPIQYKLTKTLTIAAAADTTNFTNMAFNCQSDTWTNVNTNQSVSLYNAALEGYYKCTITQTALSSGSNFNKCDIMFDYIYHLSVQAAPDIDVTEPAFNYQAKPSNQARPTIRIDHLNTPVQSQPVFVLYPNQSAGETMAIEVRLTKLDF